MPLKRKAYLLGVPVLVGFTVYCVDGTGCSTTLRLCTFYVPVAYASFPPVFSETLSIYKIII